MFSTDHIVSFTLSAVLHLLGMLLLGYYGVSHTEEPAETVPELAVSSLELTLEDVVAAVPGAAPGAAQPAAAELERLQLPEAVAEPPLQPQLPEKPDFTDALPPPEPVPAPTPVPVAVPPRSAPPVRSVKPSPAVSSPAPSVKPLPSVDVASREGGGGGGASGHIDAHPSLDRPIRPTYPIGARRRGEEGTVILDVNVAADGAASSVTLVSSSGFPELDRAAERAAAQARFKPGTRDGRPIDSAARLTLIFRLRDL